MSQSEMYSSLIRGKVPLAMSFNYSKLFLVDPSTVDISTAVQVGHHFPHQVLAAPQGEKWREEIQYLPHWYTIRLFYKCLCIIIVPQ